MNAKIILLRLAGLVMIAALGWVAFAFSIHLMIVTGQTGDLPDGSFGPVLMTRTALIWIGAVALGIVSLFIKDNWRNVLYFAPLYAPPLFVVFQTLAA